MSDQSPQIFTVSRLNGAVRLLLEQELGLVWLTGEISNLIQHGSGHWYFSLKDPAAQVRCAMFKGQNRRVAFRPQDGQQVLVQARVSLYEPRGEFQLVIESMRPAGDGALQLRLEQLKQRLAAEGLFDAARKRPLPAQPSRIGLITSPTGAAIRDMLTVLRRRCPALPVVIYPSPVQGEASVAALVAALGMANRRGECDVLIIGRGGGSLEDLWCFNDERLVRAMAASRIPLVSAVGHETDVTLADFVADLRAPTPSAAAELVSPDRESQRQRLQGQAQALSRAWQQQANRARHCWQLLAQRLHHQHPSRRLQQQQQQLDELLWRLERRWQQRQQQAQQRLTTLSRRLLQYAPTRALARSEQQCRLLEQRLLRALPAQLESARHRLSLLATRLHGISPLATLSRGYSLTLTADGQVVRAASAVEAGQQLTTRLAEGSLEVIVQRRLVPHP